jgi:hypothetical protein
MASSITEGVWCSEQRSGSVNDVADGGDRGLRTGTDLASGSVESRLIHRVLVHRWFADARGLITGCTARPHIWSSRLIRPVDRLWRRECHQGAGGPHERGSVRRLALGLVTGRSRTFFKGSAAPHSSHRQGLEEKKEQPGPLKSAGLGETAASATASGDDSPADMRSAAPPRLPRKSKQFGVVHRRPRLSEANASSHLRRNHLHSWTDCPHRHGPPPP